jgi:hypothetical protein
MRQAAVLIGAFFFFGLAGATAFAREKMKSGTAEHPPPEVSASSAEIRMGGIIIAIGRDRHKVLIRQHKVKEERIISLDLGREVLGEISAFQKGDAVNIWVRDGRVIKIEAIPDPVWEEIRKGGK